MGRGRVPARMYRAVSGLRRTADRRGPRPSASRSADRRRPWRRRGGARCGRARCDRSSLRRRRTVDRAAAGRVLRRSAPAAAAGRRPRRPCDRWGRAPGRGAYRIAPALAVARRDPARSVLGGRHFRDSRADAARDRRADPRARMIDAELIARVRSEVAAGLDPATLLALYGDPTRRRLIRERVRSAARRSLSDAEVERLCADLFGFGCLQPLLDDPRITDVLVNAPDRIFVERDGRLERVAVAFRDAAELSDLVYRIAASVGRELTMEQPFVDARMRDGSRANAVIEPVGGPCLSIRKFRPLSMPLTGAASWVSSDALSGDAAALLVDAVRTRRDIVVSGATGSGKSTLLRSLAAAIPADERI